MEIPNVIPIPSLETGKQRKKKIMILIIIGMITLVLFVLALSVLVGVVINGVMKKSIEIIGTALCESKQMYIDSCAENQNGETVVTVILKKGSEATSRTIFTFLLTNGSTISIERAGLLPEQKFTLGETPKEVSATVNMMNPEGGIDVCYQRRGVSCSSVTKEIVLNQTAFPKGGSLGGGGGGSSGGGGGGEGFSDNKNSHLSETGNNTYLLGDGVNNYAKLNSVRGLDDSEFTISMWVRKATTGPLQSDIMSLYGKSVLFSQVSSAFSYLVKYTNGEATQELKNSVASMFNDGEWHHLVLTFQKNSPVSGYSEIKVYADFNRGQVSHNLGTQNWIVRQDSTLYLGSSGGIQGVSRSFFRGDMDEVRIYNRTLSETEIQSIYAGGNKASDTLPKEGLIVWFTFDEDSGNTLVDSSGMGNNAMVFT